jgi:hypothetical protein
VDDDAVIVPGPLDWLRNPDVTFEVLIASARNGGPGLIERIRVRAAEIIGLAAHPDGSIGMLRLERPSKHRPYAETFDMDALEQELGAQPDIWAALQVTGNVPPGIQGRDVSAVLGPLVNWERQEREELVNERLGDPQGSVRVICCVFVSCSRCFICSGEWW